MKYTIIAVALVVVLGIGYYIMTSSSSGISSYTATTTDNSAAITPAPSSVTVDIKNFAFSPSALSVKVGTKVTWTNNDSVPHTVTSDSGDLLNSSTLSPGQSFSFTLTVPGSNTYHCAIHPTMKGAITVTN